MDSYDCFCVPYITCHSVIRVKIRKDLEMLIIAKLFPCLYLKYCWLVYRISLTPSLVVQLFITSALYLDQSSLTGHNNGAAGTAFNHSTSMLYCTYKCKLFLYLSLFLYSLVGHRAWQEMSLTRLMDGINLHVNRGGMEVGIGTGTVTMPTRCRPIKGSAAGLRSNRLS